MSQTVAIISAILSPPGTVKSTFFNGCLCLQFQLSWASLKYTLYWTTKLQSDKLQEQEKTEQSGLQIADSPHQDNKTLMVQSY